jgi:hypothetical protein
MNKILPFKIGINVELLYTSPDILKYSFVLLVFLGIVIFSKNTMERMNEFNMNVGKVIVLSIITVASILSLSKVSEFLYFNF